MSEYFEYNWTNQKYRHDIDLTEEIKTYHRNEPTDRARALVALKELICASMDYALKDKSCYDDDEFLYRFLYARKFNVNESFKLIINYHAYRQKNSIILQRLSVLDETIQLALRDGFPGVLTDRDRRGRKVLVFFTSNWDYSSYSLLTVYRAMLLSLEKLLEEKQNQANGFVAIVDWTNFTFRQSSHLNPKVLKLMIEGLQDCFPARFKAIHFIGQPWYVEAALAVIRPFLKEKTRARIKLHGGNLSTLHECIARDILPTELGGEGKTFNPLNFYHQLLESSQITTDQPQPTYCITQSAIYSKTQPPTTILITNDKENNNNSDYDFEDSKLIKSISNKKSPNKNNNSNNNKNNNDPANNTLLGLTSEYLT